MVEMNLQGKVKHQKENLGLENLTEQQPSEWLEVLWLGFLSYTILFLFFGWSIVFPVRSVQKMLQIVAIGNTRLRSPK
jgi:hypothetical protein